MASIPIYLLYYNFIGLYQQRSYRLYEELKGVIKANTYGIITLVLILFVFKIVDFSRYVLVTFYGLNILFTFIIRATVIKTVQNYRSKGLNLKKCLLIGYNDIGKKFIRSIENNKSFGYQIVGILDDVTIKRRELPDSCTFKGEINALQEMLKRYEVDVVTIALEGASYDKLGAIIDTCEKNGIKPNIIPYY